ncbi:MAG: hypothetical protein J0I45_00020 [Bosea sp.]|nr:hypothetical protein [Bosea sp. (in: a-proteobacteria)]
MRVFATVDAGRATGFFPDDLFPTPPAGAVEIAPELWFQWVQEPDKILVDGVLVDPPAPPPLTGDALAALKAALCAAIDAEAERQRLRFITPGAGQAMTYARKLEEAKTATIDPSPTAEAYPLLAASLGIDGDDVAAVAAVVIAMDAAWTSIGAAIEAARLAGKKTVKDAADEAGARAAAAAVEWPA